MAKSIDQKDGHDNGFVPGGFIFLARKFLKSEIYLRKPLSWRSIWLHILLCVNYDDEKPVHGLSKGSGYFSFPQHKDYLRDVNKFQWHRCITWLKTRNMIDTKLTPRGLVIKVLNWQQYQDTQTYTIDPPKESPKPKKITVDEKRDHWLEHWGQYVKELGDQLYAVHDDKTEFQRIASVSRDKFKDMGKSPEGKTITESAIDWVNMKITIQKNKKEN